MPDSLDDHRCEFRGPSVINGVRAWRCVECGKSDRSPTLDDLLTPEVQARVTWRHNEALGLGLTPVVWRDPSDGRYYCTTANEPGQDYAWWPCGPWAPLTEVFQAYAAVEVERAIEDMIDGQWLYAGDTPYPAPIARALIGRVAKAIRDSAPREGSE